MKIKKILCPIDFSDPSRQAFDEACELAKRLGATIKLLHVYQPPAYLVPDGTLLPSPAQMEAVLAGIDQSLGNWKAMANKAGVAGVEAEAVQGLAWSEIVQRASESNCDLIVMGTHGHTGFKHMLLGSVAERVVQHATCPVLTVRAKKKAASKAA